MNLNKLLEVKDFKEQKQAKTKKLLIIGASGLIGNAITHQAKKKGHVVYGTYFSHLQQGLIKLDYGDEKELNKIIDNFYPDVIICPAAKANVDWIEQNPYEAWKTNIFKLSKVFEIAHIRKIPIAFFSSDYIFDGQSGPYKEDGLPNPLNIYGKHKLISELMLKTLFGEKYFIFRTTWVFGEENQEKNLIYSLTKDLNSGEKVKAPQDMISTPTYVQDLAKFALEIIENNYFGTFNLTSGELITRFDFAKLIAKTFKLNESLIIGATYSEMNYIAQRPLKAGLVNEKANKVTGLQWTSLIQALEETKIMIEKSNQFSLDEKKTVSVESLKEQHKALRICIFIPCYNAATTLPKVFERIPIEVKNKVEEVFVVDNNSTDFTYLLAIGYREKNSDIKNLKILKNVKNFGYGGSQKLAYAYAIKNGYDIVIMLHGDAQYAPEKLPIMIETMEKDRSIDLLFGSRMTGDPLKGGMPIHRYLGNKVLTFIQNIFLGTKISEFHSGYRIFRTSALKKVPFHLCDSYYHFDTEIIIQFINKNLNISEVPIDTYYGTEKCYVNIWKYGIHILVATICYFLYKIGLRKGIKKYDLYREDLESDIDKIFNEFKTEIH